jgi:hypothetical protein
LNLPNQYQPSIGFVSRHREDPIKKKSKNIRMRKNPTPGDTIIKEEEEEEGCEWN